MNEKIMRKLSDRNVRIGDYEYTEVALVDGVSMFDTNQVALRNIRTSEHRIIPRDDVWFAAQKDETLLTYFIAKEFAGSKATSEFVSPEVAKSLVNDADKWKAQARKWEKRNKENFEYFKQLEKNYVDLVNELTKYQNAYGSLPVKVEFTDEQKADFEKLNEEIEENIWELMNLGITLRESVPLEEEREESLAKRVAFDLAWKESKKSKPVERTPEDIAAKVEHLKNFVLSKFLST